jgi:molybdopterin synthase sulfur carrier subunit
MPLQIMLFATLRRFVPGFDPYQGLALDIPPGTTPAQIIRQLGLPPEDVTLILVDGVQQQPEYQLQGNERVALFPPIGGG